MLRPSSRVRSLSGRAERLAVGLLVGLLVGGAAMLARLSGVLDGATALTGAALVAVAIPTSSVLSRRVLIAGSLFLGWAPLLWWVNLPVGSVGRMGPVLAVAAGGLAGWVASGADARLRLRRLVPRVTVLDAAPLAFAAATAWATWPLLSASSGDRMLNLLMKSGWDHAPHFAMVHVIRAEGAITPLLGPSPDGTAWVESSYPQHFHSTLVALTELASGPTVGDAATEVLRYGRGLALIQILLVAILTAGVAQLSGLRTRPALGFPLAGLVFAAFTMGPGAVSFASGYPNLVFAAATASLALLAATTCTDGFSAVRFAAICGLVVATAHAWLLLAPLAVGSACLALPSVMTRFRAPGWRQWVSVGVVLIVAAIATLAVLPILSGSGAIGAITGGGAATYSMSVFLLSSLGALAVALSSATSLRDIRASVLIAVPASALALVGGLGFYQLVKTGALAYYFGKLAVGASLVCIVALIVAVAVRTGTTEPRRHRRIVTALVAAAGTAGLMQIFGYVGPQLATPFPGTSALLKYRNAARALMAAGPSAESQRLLGAAAVAQRQPFGETSYVAALPGDPIPLLADQWAHALSLTWTRRTTEAARELNFGVAFSGPNQIADVVTRLVGHDRFRIIVMAPELLPVVRPLLPAAIRTHVVSWR